MCLSLWTIHNLLSEVGGHCWQVPILFWQTMWEGNSCFVTKCKYTKKVKMVLTHSRVMKNHEYFRLDWSQHFLTWLFFAGIGVVGDSRFSQVKIQNLQWQAVNYELTHLTAMT